MTREALTRRICSEYREMPGLCLTVQQASRLWQIDASACASILEVLVADHVLKKTAAGSFVADGLSRPEAVNSTPAKPS